MIKSNPFKAFLLFYLLMFNPFLSSQSLENSGVETSPQEITLNIVGDLMAHIDQVKGAWLEEEQLYDFRPAFRYVKPFLEDAHITLGNLETTFASPEGAHRLIPDTAFQGYQGYPYFNTPDAFGEALRDAGFDVLSVANNHSLDSGMKGARRTRATLLGQSMMPVGSGMAANDGIYYRIQGGMKIAFLSYTYCTNEFTHIEEGGFKVNSLNMYKQPLITSMLEEVRKAADQSDFTVVMIHYGWSYRYLPDDWQKALTDQLLQAGADFVAGNHPHVLQPMNYRVNGDGEEAFQIYSLSNFISHQRYAGTPPVSRDGGVILRLTLEKGPQGKGIIKRVEYMPTWVRMRGNQFTVIPVDPALADPQAYELSPEEIARLQFLQKESPHILGGSEEVGTPYRSFEPPRVDGNTSPAAR